MSRIFVNGQKDGILSYLREYKVLSKQSALAAGIADPNRVVNHLRADGYDIDTTSLRDTTLLEGGTWYELKSCEK